MSASTQRAFSLSCNAHRHGILLYYTYVDLSDQQADVHQWMLCLCRDLDLRGRVRVAMDGINCTVSSFVIIRPSPTGRS